VNWTLLTLPAIEMSFQKRHFLLLVFFFSVYWCQGMNSVFASTIEQPWLEGFGLGLTFSANSLNAYMISWWIKPLIAFPQDRFSFFGLGHRIPYVFLGVIIAAISLGLIPLVNPSSNSILFFFLRFLCGFGLAMADCAVDGYAVDLEASAKNEPSVGDTLGGLIQGIMSSGFAIGAIVGNGVAGEISKTSLNNAVYFLASMIIVTLPIVFFVTEDKSKYTTVPVPLEPTSAVDTPVSPNPLNSSSRELLQDEREPKKLDSEADVEGSPLSLQMLQPIPIEDEKLTTKAVLVSLYHSFRQRHQIALVFFLIIAIFGNQVASFPLNTWARQTFNFQVYELANMSLVAQLASFFTSITVGYFFDRIDKRFFLYTESLLYIVVNFLPIFTQTKEQTWLFWIINSISNQMNFVAVNRLMVLYSSKESGATFFATTAAISNFANMAGNSVGAFLAEEYSYNAAFIVGSVVCIFMVIPIHFLTKMERSLPLCGWEMIKPEENGKESPAVVQNPVSFDTVNSLSEDGTSKSPSDQLDRARRVAVANSARKISVKVPSV
jgi:MFS family permease